MGKSITNHKNKKASETPEQAKTQMEKTIETRPKAEKPTENQLLDHKHKKAHANINTKNKGKPKKHKNTQNTKDKY